MGTVWEWIGIWLTADWRWIEIGLAGLTSDWHRIGMGMAGLTLDWHRIDAGLALDRHEVGNGLPVRGDGD